MATKHEAMEDGLGEEKKPDSPQVKEVREDVEKYKAIEAVLNQEGGKILMSALRSDILTNVEGVISLLKAPEIELRTAVAKLAVNLNFYRALKRSSESAILASEALSKLLEEEV